jgi:hypothetical protein
MQRVALFGEAEKGKFNLPFVCNDLYEFALNFGNPPEDSEGLFFAVQALLYNREIIFFRVKEEGFSIENYLSGLNFLKNQENIKHLEAICIPGVGSKELIEETSVVCNIYKSLIITTEKDLFDYLISVK